MSHTKRVPRVFKLFGEGMQKLYQRKNVCGRQSASSAITRSNTCTRPSSRKHQLGAEQSSFFDDHVDDTLKPRLHELTILLSKSLHLRKRPL